MNEKIKKQRKNGDERRRHKLKMVKKHVEEIERNNEKKKRAEGIKLKMK